MKIDHVENPLGIIDKYFLIPLHLEGRIIGITEEGFDDVNWYEINVVYTHSSIRKEIGGNLNNYKKLRRGAPTLKEAQSMLIKWCNEMDIDTFKVENLMNSVGYA
ncbi:MAG: hypothetical protein PHF86_15320 [Candidatus Nanoarchaeia archaeon]|nr:hypothetical protein [Candidatus Nanoarchaeia archaeon]